MNKLTIFLLISCLGSCAHHSQRGPLALPFAPELVGEVQRSGQGGRSIASVDWAQQEERSLRRTYFRALNHQYGVLGLLLGRASSMKFCPQFHHDRLETTVAPKTLANGSPILGPGFNGAFFPETSFTSNFTLSDYFAEVEAEIFTLCEEGTSDNYYKFDNLVTHYAGRPSFHLDPGSMASLLKIPVFANLYLTKMLQVQHREDTIVHAEEQKVIDLTRTQWFASYLDRASKIRRDLLRNSMVKR